MTRQLFKELGVWKLAKGASWIGIDVQQRTIDSLIQRVESMLADPEHPWRQKIEAIGHALMLELADNNSRASQRLNQTKDALLDSPQVLNFISGAVVILCDAIKQDLQKPDSGIAHNIRVSIQQIGENIISNQAVRDVAQSTPQRHCGQFQSTNTAKKSFVLSVNVFTNGTPV